MEAGTQSNPISLLNDLGVRSSIGLRHTLRWGDDPALRSPQLSIENAIRRAFPDIFCLNAAPSIEFGVKSLYQKNVHEP